MLLIKRKVQACVGHSRLQLRVLAAAATANICARACIQNTWFFQEVKKKKKGKERKKGGYGGLSSKGCVRTGCKQAGHFFPFPRQRSITADATTGGTSPTCRWEHRRPPRRPPHPTKNRTSLHWIARHSPPRVKNAERQKETGQPNEKEEQANGRVKREATGRPRASRGDKEIGTGRITGARVVWGSDGGVGAHHGRDRPNEAGEK